MKVIRVTAGKPRRHWGGQGGQGGQGGFSHARVRARVRQGFFPLSFFTMTTLTTMTRVIDTGAVAGHPDFFQGDHPDHNQKRERKWT